MFTGRDALVTRFDTTAVLVMRHDKYSIVCDGNLELKLIFHVCMFDDEPKEL